MSFFILKEQLLWKLGLISRIVWSSHVFNLIVIIGFYISSSQSLKILLKYFLEKKEDSCMTVLKKIFGIHLALFFLEHFCIKTKKMKCSCLAMLKILKTNPLQNFFGPFITTNLKKIF